MAEKLIIWIRNDDASDAHWLVLDANGNKVGFPQHGPLETAAPLAAGRRVIVLVPGERIISAAARVPGNNSRRILQAAPYALEERLAGDVETLHVALLARGADQLCDFLVVERAWLDEQLALIRATGIHVDHLWPDYFGLPGEAGVAHWMITDKGRLLGREGWSGFAAPVEDADFLHAHRNDENPLRVTIVGDQELPSSLGNAEIARLADNDRAFAELASHIAALPGQGLLQGAFRQKRDDQVEWRRWRWPAAAAAAWLVIGLATLALDAWRLEREIDFLEQASHALFEQALPNSRRIPGQERYLVEQALGSIDVADSRLLQIIGNVADALQGISKARLNGFNFRNDHFEMSVTVPDATTLEQLRDALAERSGQEVDVSSANSTQDGLEGRLLISGGNAQ